MQVSQSDKILLLVLIIIAILRLLFFNQNIPEYKNILGENVEVSGVVEEEPTHSSYGSRFIIKPDNWKSKIIINTSFADIHEEISYGDYVSVSGVLEEPENFKTSSGKEFDYKKYLANQNIYLVINKADPKVIEHNQGNRIKSILYKVRSSFLKNMNHFISPPESDLAGGLLLGIKSGFDNSLRDEFINTGTIHIVALSGYNVTIVAESVMKLFQTFFTSLVSISLGVISIILFVILSGSSATAVRAGIMALIALLARGASRRYKAGRALFIAGYLMFISNPKVIFDLSFLLSFLATIGVLFLTPKILKWFKFITMRFGLREIVSSTCSATIMVLPLILHSSGVLSLVSLPTNILILPVIPITMFFSFMAGLVNLFSSILSLPFAYISNFLLSYILKVIHVFASIPFASLNIKSFPLVLVFATYVFLFWWLFHQNKK